MDADRRRMVDALAIHEPRVRQALLATPRDAFVPDGSAHEDAPQPIGAGQTISAPHMVAIMADALDVRPGHRVLEVGGGSGYHAAVLAHLAEPGPVASVEIVPDLAERARRTLAQLGIDNVEVVVGDGSEGHAPRAPYDRVSVAAGAPDVPPPLLEQLAPGGVLVLPVGPLQAQHLVRVRKDERGDVGRETLGPVRFVPLVGRHGWPT